MENKSVNMKHGIDITRLKKQARLKRQAHGILCRRVSRDSMRKLEAIIKEHTTAELL